MGGRNDGHREENDHRRCNANCAAYVTIIMPVMISGKQDLGQVISIFRLYLRCREVFCRRRSESAVIPPV